MNATTQQKDHPISKLSPETSDQFLKRLQGLSDVQKVEELASLFFTVDQIAQFVGLDTNKFRNDLIFDKQNILVAAYYRGQLKTKIKLRFDTRRYADAGSPSAEYEMLNFLTEQKISENA